MDNKNLGEIIRFIKASVAQPKTNVEVKEEDKFVGEIKDFVTSKDLFRNLTNKGFTKATPIQAKSIPVIREGKDILGLANTGTGKTAAYLIPLIEKTLKDRSKTLILVPTRELAIQIKNEIYLFTKDMPVRSEIVIGGADMYRQIQNLRRNPDFVVGTPGRIKDQKQRGHINIKNYDNIVLDEADRMLDMGFINEIKDLLKEKKPTVQSLFFSATMDRKVAMLINEFCKAYETIEISQQKVTDLIDQKILNFKDDEEKSELMQSLLGGEDFGKSIIFVNTKHRADKLMKQLNDMGFRTDALHGDKSQNLRQRIMRNYKENKFDHLIATDVAARGIDVKDVTHVINYDVPSTVEDYIHRVGRTGRAGKVGVAITLIKE
jgi:superfamily II DNA/RNA helicase